MLVCIIITMKTKKYTASKHFTQAMESRTYLTMEKCVAVIEAPLKVEQQEDGRFKFWGVELGGTRYLRVVTEADKLEIVTAMRDRRFKP